MTTAVITTSSGPLTASGVTAIPFTFPAISASEIAVTRDGVLVAKTTFTVTLNADGTGSITPTSSWGSDSVTITSAPDFTQPVSFARYGAFYPDQITPPLDRLARTLNSLRDNTARSIAAIPAGSPGAAGSTILSGTTAPGSGVGSNGDYYFDTVAKYLYGPKAAGAWPAGTSLAGANGTGTPGVNGGIGSSAGNAALFSAAAGMTIGAGITSFRTAGYSVAGKGGGEYVYDPLVNAAFVTAYPRAAFLAADGRGFRLAGRYFLQVEQLGAIGDFLTDDTVAFTAAEAYANKYTCIISIMGRYYLPSGFNAHKTNTWVGAGGQAYLNYNVESGTLIRSGNNVNGWVWNKGNTHGDGLGTQGDSSGSCMTGVAFLGGNLVVNGTTGAIISGLGATSSTGNGVRNRATFITMTDVLCAFHGNNGFDYNCSAGSGGYAEGNANNWTLNYCQAIYNGNDGYQFAGTDTNAGTTNCCSSISNGGAGIRDYTFLGNTHVQYHIRDCGITDPLLLNKPVGSCQYGGSNYAVGYNQETAASTTIPGTNSTVWVPWPGLPNGGAKVWTSGLTWQFARPFMTNPGNVGNGRGAVYNGYHEGAMAPVIMGAGWKMDNGVHQEVGIDPLNAGVVTSCAVGAFVAQAFKTDNAQYGSVKYAMLGGNLGSAEPNTWSLFYDGTYNWRLQSPSFAAGVAFTVASTSVWDAPATFGSLTYPIRLRTPLISDTTGDLNTGRPIAFGTAAPTTGTWFAGSRVFNKTPGSISQWLCTTDGTPGTWIAIYSATALVANSGSAADLSAGTLARPVASTGTVTSISPTAGVGYATGAGGTATQATSKATGVTLNKVCGQITLNNASLAASTAVSFVLTNSTIAATDIIKMNVASGAATPGSYLVQCESFGTGSCTVSVRNMTAGSLSEALVLNYAIIKGVAA